VAAHPLQHLRPRLPGRLRMVTRAGVIEGRVVGVREGHDLVRDARLFERRFRRIARGVHAGVALGVDGEDGSLRAREVRAVGQRTIERSRGGQAGLLVAW